jgi:tetratricopeptide (TPR) repeat protein
MRAEDYDEWFWVPLALALLLLMVEPWARTRRGKSVQEPDLPPLTLPAGAAEGAGSPERAGSVMQRRLHGLASLKILFFLLLPAVALSQAVEEKELTAWLQQKKYPELEGRLQKAIQDDYQNWVAIYDLGLVYYAQKKYSEALDCFEKALSSPDESLRDKAYFQLGNAQVRLSENSWQGNLAALDTALQNYRQLEKTKLRQEGQHNAEVTLALLRQTALKQGKDILEKTLAVPPPAATQDPKPYIDQNRGLQRVVETVEVLLRYEENQAEAQALKQKASEAWASNLDKMASLDEAVAEKKFAEGPPNQPAFHAGLRAQENALRRLEQAKELAPTDAALQAHYEKAKNREVEQLLASAEAYRQKGDFYALEQAGQALDMAEGYAPGDERVKKLREEVRAALEAAALQQADQYALNFEKSAQTPAERNEGAARQAALFLNRSIEMYRKVLDVNAANERAKAQLAKLEPKQAEIFAKMGQTELAVAKKALASSKEALSKVKEAVGHLQNAENGFTQAQALGQNSPEIQGAHEEAAKMLTELQTQMDQMLAQNPPPQEPKQNPPGDGVSAPPAQVFTYQRLRQLTVRQTQGNNKPPPAVKRDW